MSRLMLYLLGPPRIEYEGTPIEVDRRKAIALIIYLAMTEESHSRDRLATLFWPNYDQSRARSALRSALWALNRTPAGNWLDVSQETLGLHHDANLWVDVAHFRHLLETCRAHNHPPDEVCPTCLPPLTEAVALYRDNFMAGFTLPDSPAFDEWQVFQSESLRQELASALERLIRSFSAQEEYKSAISYARRWLGLEPWREEAHQHLMRLFARNGQRSAALAQYESCRRFLAEELAVEPAAETVALYEQIRAGELSKGETPSVHVHQGNKGGKSGSS
jgi:DNA-binding SARP family transcriptional activator